MFSIELVKRRHLAIGGKQTKHHFFRKMCLKKVKDLYGDVKDVFGGPGYHSEKIIFDNNAHAHFYLHLVFKRQSFFRGIFVHIPSELQYLFYSLYTCYI